MTDRAESVRDGVVARLRTLLLVFDRQDRLETAQEFVGWLAEETNPERLAEHSRELLLRALRVAGDPINYRVLSLLDPIEPAGLSELMELTGLGRVALSERLNDMVQTGLAVREMVNDHVRGTDLGAGLTSFVEDVAADAGSDLARNLAREGPSQARGGALR